MSPRNRPLAALRALRALSADPDDLPKVFTIIDSLPGHSPERMLARLRSGKEGRELLATKPNLGVRLADRAALLALPKGTLGHAYAEMVEREGITPQGIIDASVAGRTAPEDFVGISEDQRFFGERMRDTHDLWHVVTGYGTDLVGEAALLAFSYAQTSSPGIGLVVFLAVIKGDPKIWRMLLEGYRRGSRAKWLPEVAWESLLALPLEDVRKRLAVGALAPYEAITSATLRENGSLRRAGHVTHTPRAPEGRAAA